MQFFWILSLAVLGLCFGSFAGATVWRLRAKQLEYDKKQGEPVDPKEYKRLRTLQDGFGAHDRSRCLSCQHTLAWYDLLPMASWLSTRGKCRYCKQPIGWFEPLIEITTALVFVLSYLLWPFGFASSLHVGLFALWLVILIGLTIIFWYDSKWFLVLWVTIWPLLILATIFALLQYVIEPETVTILSVMGSITILAGLYWLLWAASKGAWVGLGDAQIGAVLGLILVDWRKAFLALLLANAIGTLVVIPGLLTKKLTRKSAVPFGPLLISGALISFLLGDTIIAWFTGDFSLFLARLFYP